MAKWIQVNKLSRRQFLAVAGLAVVAVGGAGLALRAYRKHKRTALPTGPVALPTGQRKSLNLFVHIGEDNRVTLVAHRSEMGQGVRTSLPQILADELEADWDKVDIVQAPGDARFGDQDTDGSHSVTSFYDTLRELGASARTMLCLAAAETWQVSVDECVAKAHQVHHLATGRVLNYGELASAAAKQKIPEPALIKLKATSDFKYIGQPLAMVDFEDIVRGTAEYGQDIHLPDMLHASVERSPVLGGKIKSYDASKTKALSGVVDVIKISGGFDPSGFHPIEGLAVLATNTWAAREGRKLLSITWDTNSHSTYDSRATIEQLAKAGKPATAKTQRERGQVDSALAKAKQTLQVTYTVPHLEHATMEPPAATVVIKGNKCEVWACVQNPQAAQNAVVDAIGFNRDDILVHNTLLGGGFGRKSKPDFVAEAALVAKAAGRPVKVSWTREDALRNGFYHAYSVQQFKGALDEKGKLLALDACVASPSIGSLFQAKVEGIQSFELAQGFVNVPYENPHLKISSGPAEAHTRIGWMRSVYNINHAFGQCSFIDEMAHLAKRDPLEFLLESIGSDRIINTTAEGFPDTPSADFAFKTSRLKAVLRAAATSANWPSKTPSKEGWGLATHHSFNSYTAVATKVSLAEAGLKILEVHIAIDCGQIVNPDRVKSQMEGAVIFGLSAALFGEISFKEGKVEQSTFDDYPLLRFHQSPKIVVTLIDSPEKHGGVGEPGVPPIAPSVVNAIAAAGGPRIRDLPIRKHLTLA